jgi:hypothetical protein
MESDNRNTQGRFVSGHKGSKPKGAMNKNTRDYLARLDKISNLLEVNLEDNINSLSKKDQVMLWLEIEKFKHIKMAKFSEPDPSKEPITKITFEVVDSHGKPYDDRPAPLAAAASVPLQSVPVPPAANTPIQSGAIDMGRVRSPNRFGRIKRI